MKKFLISVLVVAAVGGGIAWSKRADILIALVKYTTSQRYADVAPNREVPWQKGPAAPAARASTDFSESQLKKEGSRRCAPCIRDGRRSSGGRGAPAQGGPSRCKHRFQSFQAFHLISPAHVDMSSLVVNQAPGFLRILWSRHHVLSEEQSSQFGHTIQN